MSKFIWPIRVYYEDTDSGGIVYHANYLKFMERARTEWLRNLGFEQDQLRQELQVLFAVRSIEVDYKKPALFNDELDVVTEVERPRHASLVFSQRITRRSETKPEELVHAIVKVACIDANRMKPVPLPDTIKMEIQNVG
ncbi:tol-pal system-associated acyl-CoA thioesterase [Alkalilimnicola ehrlichii]|uniref:Tol-pal system-associated acyl-CoA thioesterase n=1 Tax=Alkalilimnicola ehrlichii TaxID=351052 RepID=A0A3E0X150_9GAMM|nr:tol-pal system-associated acyl-CoA thioesterase [Alkalilimnicola ehrlichii]RFA31349.1 tol-pal system-associated acyl-CoA thioesterase [Alkalilimnicola ehrlichii]RFA39379.1 tol-pal system-associated acyl-CoA thioesterase [Alkalilimnicola ehrlichii]